MNKSRPCADPEGRGQLVPQQYWFGSPGKSQSYQASVQCWTIIGPPTKWRFDGGPMMADFLLYLDPSQFH